MRTVVLVGALALGTFQARPYLCADTHTVAYFDDGHVLANLDSLSDNLVAYAKGTLVIAPAARDGVHIGAAYTASLDLNINIPVAKGLGLQLVLIELGPRLGACDAEAFEGVWVTHDV